MDIGRHERQGEWCGQIRESRDGRRCNDGSAGDLHGQDRDDSVILARFVNMKDSCPCVSVPGLRYMGGTAFNKEDGRPIAEDGLAGTCRPLTASIGCGTEGIRASEACVQSCSTV